jgi:hypothetical protein
MLDVESAVALGIVGPLNCRDHPSHVLGMNVRHDLRKGRLLLGVPAVEAAELGRPIDYVALVIVFEDPDASGSDCLSQALVVIVHESIFLDKCDVFSLTATADVILRGHL